MSLWSNVNEELLYRVLFWPYLLSFKKLLEQQMRRLYVIIWINIIHHKLINSWKIYHFTILLWGILKLKLIICHVIMKYYELIIYHMLWVLILYPQYPCNTIFYSDNDGKREEFANEINKAAKLWPQEILRQTRLAESPFAGNVYYSC